MNENLLEKSKKLIENNYDSEDCVLTEECSEGNSMNVFIGGQKLGKSYLAYEISKLLESNLEEPKKN